MKLITIFILLFGFAETISAQDTIPKSVVIDTPYLIVGERPKPPMFPGGDAELECYIDKSIDSALVYSQVKKGRVVVEFTVTSTGHLKKFKIRRSYSKAIDKEFIRILKLMPNWIPSELDGICFETNCIIPLILPYAPELFCR